MDPQTKSVLTSIAMSIAVAITTWAVKSGLIQSSGQAALASALANVLVAVAAGTFAAAMGYLKLRAHTKDAQIAAVNKSDNGVKVVPESSPTPAVNRSLK